MKKGILSLFCMLTSLQAFVQYVGIRTANPQGILHISGVSNPAVIASQNYVMMGLNEQGSLAESIQFSRAGNSNSWKWLAGFNASAGLATLNWGYNNDRWFIINGLGYLGIDTLPGRPLSVHSNLSLPMIIDGPENAMLLLSESNTARGYIGNTQLGTGNRNIELGTYTTNTTGSVHLVTGGSPKLTVTSVGGVGLGTTNPLRNLSADGGIVIDQNNGKDSTYKFSNLLVFGDDPVSGVAIGSQRNAAGNRQYGLDFYHRKNKAITILNNGNVGFYKPSPAEKLEVPGELYMDKFRFSNGNTFPAMVQGYTEIYFEYQQEEYCNINFSALDSTKPIQVLISIKDGEGQFVGNWSKKFSYDFIKTDKTHGRIIVRFQEPGLLGTYAFPEGVWVHWIAIQKK
jgi:hypothetical protein